jgi:putative ABC transport system permease protein
VLSGFRPAGVLKGAFGSSQGGLLLRKGLVVFQFAVSVALIAGTAAVFTQLDYLHRRHLGFNKEQMLVIDFHADSQVWSQVESIKRELTAQPGVVGAAASGYVPNGQYDTFGRQMQTGSGEMRNASFKTYDVDYDFLPLFEIKLVAGRNFSPEFPTDSLRALIVNETAVKHLGYASPEDIIGAAWSFGPDGTPGTIIGVVKDFHFESLHRKVEPLALQFLRFQVRYLTLRINTEQVPETIAALQRSWTELVPHRPLDYSFLDETFGTQYRSDERFGQLFGIFAGLAIFIACLGLFGLATFTVQQRTKEIGVRKVLGASAGSIAVLLSKDFLKLVLVAFVVAVPVAWFAMTRWLQNFAYRIELGPGLFLLAGALALLIALTTVSYQSIRAALSDPVKSLRYE